MNPGVDAVHQKLDLKLPPEFVRVRGKLNVPAIMVMLVLEAVRVVFKAVLDVLV